MKICRFAASCHTAAAAAAAFRCMSSLHCRAVIVVIVVVVVVVGIVIAVVVGASSSAVKKECQHPQFQTTGQFAHLGIVAQMPSTSIPRPHPCPLQAALGMDPPCHSEVKEQKVAVARVTNRASRQLVGTPQLVQGPRKRIVIGVDVVLVQWWRQQGGGCRLWQQMQIFSKCETKTARAWARLHSMTSKGPPAFSDNDVLVVLASPPRMTTVMTSWWRLVNP
jgi:hypothetical protein